MSYAFLALDTSLIPQATKDNVPTYTKGYFSNNGSRLLIPGYQLDENGNHFLDEDGEPVLAHFDSTFNAWLNWSVDKQALLDRAFMSEH